MKCVWNRRQLEWAVSEFHDKTIDPQANYISWSAAKIWLDLQLSPSWVLQRETIERKCVRMEEDSTILLDGKTMKYILKVDAQVHHKLGSTYNCTDAFLDVCLSNFPHPSDTTQVAIIRQRTKSVTCSMEMYLASTSPMI